MKALVFTTFALIAMGAVTASQTSGQPSESQDMKPPVDQGSSNTSSAQDRSGQQPQSIRSASDQTGQVNQSPASKLTFYQGGKGDLRASELIGTEVYNRNNENVSEVEDLLIDDGKVVKAVILSTGGFLGMGERNVAVHPDAVALTNQSGGPPRVVVNTTKDELKNAPEFSELGGAVAGTKTRYGGTIE